MDDVSEKRSGNAVNKAKENGIYGGGRGGRKEKRNNQETRNTKKKKKRKTL